MRDELDTVAEWDDSTAALERFEEMQPLQPDEMEWVCDQFAGDINKLHHTFTDEKHEYTTHFFEINPSAWHEEYNWRSFTVKRKCDNNE